MRQFIITSEFGDVYHHSGELPEEIFGAVADGTYDAVDITDPTQPLRLGRDGEWEPVAKLPG